jgi:hypothetical protein
MLDGAACVLLLNAVYLHGKNVLSTAQLVSV